MMIRSRDDVKFTRTAGFDAVLAGQVFGCHSHAWQGEAEAAEMLKLSRNQAQAARWKYDFASNDSSMHSKEDVWLEDGFIFRAWWFQLLLLVGGSIDNASQGPELLLLLGLSTSPQLDQLLTLA